MKKHCIIYLLAALSLASCIDDEGNNTMNPINKAQIEGIKDKYYMVTNLETLQIPVTVTGSMSGNDVNNFSFEWFLCNGAVEDKYPDHQTISREKDLSFPVNVPPGEYRLFFRVKDKSNNMVFEKRSALNVLSPYVRGFYLFGDKEDGTCGIDFISMMEGRDTSVVENLFDNTQGIKHAQQLIFMGHSYSTDLEATWAITKDGAYALNSSAKENKITINSNKQIDHLIYPSIEGTTKPYVVRALFPRPSGKDNNCLSGSFRCLLTDKDAFWCSQMPLGEAYGNPFNCYEAGSTTLVQLSPYVFYPANSSYIRTLAFYDKTNHKFVRLNGASYSVTNIADYNLPTDQPFNTDQTTYSPARDLVYGENGLGNNGQSYALMNDADGHFFVYAFRITNYSAAGMKRSLAREIDLTVASHFAEASHYAFYSNQPIVLYAVGNSLWAYNYNTNKAKMLNAYNGEITYLAMEHDSDENPDDVIVATYSPSEKGVVYKHEMKDDPNEIAFVQKQYKTKSYPWKTNLKVKSITYRNCPD